MRNSVKNYPIRLYKNQVWRQREVYSLEVIFQPGLLGPEDNSTGATMAAYVGRAPARQFPEIYPELTAQATRVKAGKQ